VRGKFFLNAKREREDEKSIFNSLSIKAPSMDVLANTLSGGNQQKVVLAKWILSNPKVLILDDPTRGLDVGAKYEIYKIMIQLAESGMAIVMISSELPEIIGMCDRVMVMSEKRVTGELKRDELSQEKIMNLATALV
jgi:ABC-type sugar transport system ATPase subunit